MLSLPDSERALRGAFPGLAATAGSSLPRLAADASRHELDVGSAILHEGEPHESLFLVCEGGVGLVCDQAGARVQIGALGRGTWFGELGFLEAGSSTAEVRATEPTLVLSISRAQFTGYIEDHPALADAILAEILPGMTQRLRKSTELIDRGAEPLTDNARPAEPWFVRALRAFFGGGA